MTFVVQKLLLLGSYWFFKLMTPRRRRESISWVVGPDEISSMVQQISRAVPRSHSVALARHPFYTYRYDSSLRAVPGTTSWLIARLVTSPILLGKLMNRAQGFIYVGSSGFLIDGVDHREFEFRFLKNHGLKICCYWCGSDIRSITRMNELERETGEPNIATYLSMASPQLGTPQHDAAKRGLARVADRYADVMYSNAIDHLGYLTKPTLPFLYFHPDEHFVTGNEKFENMSPVVVTHATSSPIIKGTQLVRAAIAKLRDEGYDFEYTELIGVSNEVVLQQLARTHIALNQFYGFSPAVFGIEALASRCAVLMSADEYLETDLPPGSNEAWLVTKHHQVYSNLKRLLDAPELIQPLAARGQAWAMAYASASSSSAKLGRTLHSVIEGTYDPENADD